MAGFTGRLNRSLQARLSIWISFGLIATALVAGLISFCIAFREANGIQDDQLRQVAALFGGHGVTADPALLKVLRGKLDEEEALISVQILGQTAFPEAGKSSKYLPALPVDLADGLQTVALGRKWRVFVSPLEDGHRLAVAQRTEYRNELALHGAARTIVPIICCIPLLVLVAFVVVRRMLRPVVQLACEVDSRTREDLTPLAVDHIPLELLPFALSINRLLERVKQVLDMQRRFVADAAHELRSPLTALSLQLQSVDASMLPPAVGERITAMTLSMDRTVALLNQLLGLAHSQSAAGNTACATFSTRRVICELLETLMPLAQKKQIDLGMVGEEAPSLTASETDFFMVARNLMDNALKYTQPGGQVDVSLHETEEAVLLVVSDNGPGIPEAERGKIFEPFYRGLGHEALGSGLGLAIVRAVLDRTGGTVCVADACPGRERPGLRISVSWPKKGSDPAGG